MDIARQFAAVLLVLGLFGVSLWALRRRAESWRGGRRDGWFGERRGGPVGTPRDTASALYVAGRVHLTPHHSLHVVRAGGREWVVAAHPQGCTVIGERNANGAAA